ncbi:MULTISPECIES: hypothetical protein [unclassified Legionella]|uniref:hypothetical protein n=1 Tax=unclassified Legionella TaxID=2622702 RepID=UPI001054FE93|nr:MULTISPECIES: hypothetical protein [unclassified Legionella]MDI9818845.1 hypothetical protein [Legionella sp. PL877]
MPVLLQNPSEISRLSKLQQRATERHKKLLGNPNKEKLIFHRLNIVIQTKQYLLEQNENKASQILKNNETLFVDNQNSSSFLTKILLILGITTQPHKFFASVSTNKPNTVKVDERLTNSCL